MENYDWSDIEPVEMETTPQLCHILYSEEYKTTMALLRLVMLAEEYSERTLLLTDHVIGLVPGHYTVWQYRLQIVKLLGKDILQELSWCDDVLLENQKNYQIWHYRQCVIEHYCASHDFDASVEYAIIDTMLVEDNKNYHVWSYRKWLVQRFDLFNLRELQFVDHMLTVDVRNNSAWNHRFLLMSHNNALELEKEIQFCSKAIALLPQNALAWNYLQGLLNSKHTPLLTISPLVAQYRDVSTALLQISAKINKQQNHKDAHRIDLLQLLQKDPIRANYYHHLIALI